VEFLGFPKISALVRILPVYFEPAPFPPIGKNPDGFT